jgi:hypothetical protein
MGDSRRGQSKDRRGAGAKAGRGGGGGRGLRIGATIAAALAMLLLAAFLLLAPEVDRSVGGAEAQARAGKPPLTLVPDMVDFGTLDVGAQVTRNVTLQNTSGQSLRVLAARSSCTCTKAELNATVIPPWGSAAMAVHFDAGSRDVLKQVDVTVAVSGYEEPISILVRAKVQGESAG